VRREPVVQSASDRNILLQPHVRGWLRSAREFKPLHNRRRTCGAPCHCRERGHAGKRSVIQRAAGSETPLDPAAIAMGRVMWQARVLARRASMGSEEANLAPVGE
jgi:hypothetical protein